ncbi:MAG: hypothetical protein D6704_02310 [Nitrospirae bacterium]|nr:MAG: hypothetical protein D6704_02310 [Nitrospirota bacterium]
MATIFGSDPLRDVHHAVGTSQSIERAPSLAKEPSRPSGGATTDVVAFSSTLQTREALIAQVHALPDIRAERVEAARDTTLASSSPVNSELVAAGLIKETLLNAVA